MALVPESVLAGPRAWVPDGLAREGRDRLAGPVGLALDSLPGRGADLADPAGARAAVSTFRRRRRRFSSKPKPKAGRQPRAGLAANRTIAGKRATSDIWISGYDETIWAEARWLSLPGISGRS